MQFLPNNWAVNDFERIASFLFDELDSEDFCPRLVAEVESILAIIYYKVQFIAVITVYVDDSFIKVVAVRILRVQ
jgi:hypothetical protein